PLSRRVRRCPPRGRAVRPSPGGPRCRAAVARRCTLPRRGGDTMRRIVGAVLLLGLVWPALGADDKPKDKPPDQPADKDAVKKDDKPASPAEQFKALQKEYSDALQEARKAAIEAKTPEEMQKARQKQVNPDKFTARFLEIAEKNPKDPAAVDALVWVVSYSRTSGKVSARGKALDILMRDHATSDKIGSVLDSMVYSRDA